MPDDKQWAADRATILQGLVLDHRGIQPTGLQLSSGRRRKVTQEDWQKERDKMVKTCNQCHSVNFAKASSTKVTR